MSNKKDADSYLQSSKLFITLSTLFFIAGTFIITFYTILLSNSSLTFGVFEIITISFFYVIGISFFALSIRFYDKYYFIKGLDKELHFNFMGIKFKGLEGIIQAITAIFLFIIFITAIT